MPHRQKPTRRKPVVARVGMRAPKTILADPLATAQELNSLSAAHPKAVIRHANCPLDLWLRLSEHHPFEALQNPAAELLLLEAPEKWAELERQYAGDWIEAYAPQLSTKDQRLFAAECVVRVLPAWEMDRPKDKRPHAAAAAARAFAQDHLTKGKLRATCTAAEKAMRDAESLYQIAEAAKLASADPLDFDSRYAAYVANAAASALADVARHADANRPGDGIAASRAYQDEQVWQWRRLLSYLRGEVVGRKSKMQVGARFRDDILTDPMATEAEVLTLSPMEQLNHPNCPLVLWWKIAQDRPLEAPNSPAGVLILLEAPERWLGLELEQADRWIRAHLSRLSHAQRRLFAADCAERVLSSVERENPTDDLPRQAIATARAFAKGTATRDALAEAYAAVKKSIIAAQHAASQLPIRNRWPALARESAAKAARQSVYSPFEESCAAVMFATDYAGEAAQLDKNSPHGRLQERVWQWRRLVEYLNGDVIGAKQASKGRSHVGKKTLEDYLRDKMDGKTHAKVGAKTEADIKADPMATPEEIATLTPIAQLNHPNCPQGLWIKLARDFPFAAPASPAGALFLLEEPDLWGMIEHAHAQVWVTRHLDKLSWQDARRLAADCAEHVLHFFEAKWPHDLRPRQSIAAARQYADGSIMAREVLVEANAAAMESLRAADSENNHQRMPTHEELDAASAARWASSDTNVAYLSNALTEARSAAGEGAPQVFGSKPKAKAAESVWQWHRLRAYLDEKVQGRGPSTPSKKSTKKRSHVGANQDDAMEAVEIFLAQLLAESRAKGVHLTPDQIAHLTQQFIADYTRKNPYEAAPSRQGTAKPLRSKPQQRDKHAHAPRNDEASPPPPRRVREAYAKGGQTRAHAYGNIPLGDAPPPAKPRTVKPPKPEGHRETPRQKSMRLLGLSGRFTAKEVRRAFQQASLKGAHPDHGGSQEKFLAVREAADLLLKGLSEKL